MYYCVLQDIVVVILVSLLLLVLPNAPREVQPIPHFRKWVGPQKQIVDCPRDRLENRRQRLESSRVRSRITRRRSFPDLDQMAQVAEKPPATHSAAIPMGLRNVAVLRHLGQQGGEVHAGIAGQRQRMPEASIHLHEHRRLACLPTEFHHGHPVPAQSFQDGETCAANLRFRFDAHAHRAARSRRINIANPAMGELSAKFPIMHQSEVAGSFAFHVLLDQNAAGVLAYCGRPPVRTFPCWPNSSEARGLSTTGYSSERAARSASSLLSIRIVRGTAIPSDRASSVVCCLSKARNTCSWDGSTMRPPALKMRSRWRERESVVASVIGMTSVGMASVPGWAPASSAIRLTNACTCRCGDGYRNVPRAKRDQPALFHEVESPTSTSCPALARERTAATAWFWFPSRTRTLIAGFS